MKTNLLPLMVTLVSLFVLINKEGSAVSSTIRISQVYGGGGNSGAVYQNDFIELFNASAVTVSLTGWSVQYASAASGSWNSINLSGSIAAGGYYLIQLAAGSGGSIALPTPDLVDNSLNISATAGKVALVDNVISLSGSCPSSASIIDMVGYGTTASCFEGGAAPGPSNTNSIVRIAGGCTDTDNNSSDFIAAAAAPHNSASSSNLCMSAGFQDFINYSEVKMWSSQNELSVDFSGVNNVNATIEIYNIIGQLISREKFGTSGIYRKKLMQDKFFYIIVRITNDDCVVLKKLAILHE